MLVFSVVAAEKGTLALHLEAHSIPFEMAGFLFVFFLTLLNITVYQGISDGLISMQI